MEQLKLYDEQGVSSPEKILNDALEWRKRNYQAYEQIRMMALSRLNENRRTSISELVEDVRYSMRLNGYTDGFKVNNTTRAALARLLIKQHPQLAEIIEVRKSKLDWVM